MYLNRLLTFLFLLASLAFSGFSSADTEIIEGKDYALLTNPQPTRNSEKIEVLEFFWYGCPHCNNLHPYIKKWWKDIPHDVSFHFLPAIFRTSWVPAAKLFYAMEAIGATDKLHDKAYEAIHRDKINLNKESELFNWVEEQGVDRKKFMDAYHSFTVQNQVAKSTQMSRQYQLTGVPSLVIEGKYLTSGRMGGTPEDTITVLNKLIEKVRQERNAK
ncbi:MAG: thiol:disulfide interchange protein DsbA/DsbL [Nitrosomonas sp.]|nr:thiol:disulfide interchange protein DsbA/DsbL [Nitrosomonas sp.]MDP1950085.1 thiol:disulfide interchange protein DsbA/DsbL [Nitrosomonas sp.]